MERRKNRVVGFAIFEGLFCTVSSSSPAIWALNVRFFIGWMFKWSNVFAFALPEINEITQNLNEN